MPTALHLNVDKGWTPPLHTISPYLERNYSSNDEGGAAEAATHPAYTCHHLQSPQIGEMITASHFCESPEPLEDLPTPIQMESPRLSILHGIQYACLEMDSLNATTQQLTQQEPSEWQPRITICICCLTHLTRERRLSRAKHQHTLLWRCFYPRRDVIKWIKESLHMRLPCEVSNNVQGPLKSFCCQLRLGVGLTCVRTIHNSARDELVENIETSVSCQLRLSSLLQHINPGYDMRFLGFVYCVFALPEYWH